MGKVGRPRVENKKKQFSTRLDAETMSILDTARPEHGKSKARFVEESVKYYKEKLLRRI